MQSEIEHFLNYLVVQKNCTKNTIAAYQNDLTQFVSFLEDFEEPYRKEANGEEPSRTEVTTWQDVQPSLLEDYLVHLQAQDYAPSTVARKVAAVKSFFGYLHDCGEVPRDLVGNLKPPKVEKTLPRPIPLEDVARLLAEPAKTRTPKGLRDRALLAILYATGMRVSELVNLNVDDIDLENATVTCGTSHKRRRTVPINEETLAALQAYLAKGRGALVTESSEKGLFLNHRGSRLTRQGLWLIIREYVQAVGIDEQVTPHTLRHSIATHLLNAGAKLQEVQERLGHASVSTTQVYRKISDETANEVLIDGAIAGSQRTQQNGLPLPAGTD